MAQTWSRLAALLILAAALHSSHAQQEYPPDCACPEACHCNLRGGVIDCESVGINYIPTEINSCSWPGIYKVCVPMLSCVDILRNPLPVGNRAWEVRNLRRSPTHASWKLMPFYILAFHNFD